MDEKENFRTKKVWRMFLSICNRLTVYGNPKYYPGSFAKIIEWELNEKPDR